MDSHFEIYENSAFSYADAEESLFVKPTTPPPINNLIII